jgi:hypothetical protein
LDFSDFPQAALQKIREAQVEADYIVRTGAESLRGEGEAAKARNKAARHLLAAVATPLWVCVWPSIETYEERLKDAAKWVYERFHPDMHTLTEEVAWNLQFARDHPADPRPERHLGVLARAARRAERDRQKAIRNGGLEACTELPPLASTQSSPIAYPCLVGRVGHEPLVTPVWPVSDSHTTDESEVIVVNGRAVRADTEGKPGTDKASRPADPFAGLTKKTDLSTYQDLLSTLTERQQVCFSLKMEYGLGVTEIASRLGLHHKTVQEHVGAAKNRIEQVRAKTKRAANRAKHDPEN